MWYYNSLGCCGQTTWYYWINRCCFRVRLYRIRYGSFIAHKILCSLPIAGVINAATLVNASRIIAIDTNPDKEAWAKKFGATDFLNPKELPEGKRIQDYLVEITDGGLDYTFDATGNVRGHPEAGITNSQ
jgi:Zn-dependent alcohol dehydrogenase